MGRHVVFVTPPVPGHVHPALPLVKELIARGHRVSFITSPPFMRAVGEAGATGIELGWDPDPSTLPVEFTFDSLLVILEEFLATARQAFPGLVEHFRRNQPDLVCSDSVVLGPLLAGVFDVPRVSLVPTLLSNRYFSPRKIVPGFSPVHPRLAAYGASVAAFAADYDLPASIDMVGMKSALKLVFLPREFQIAGDTFDDTYQFIGPSIGHRAHSGAWNPPDGDSPVLFVSLGTAFNYRPDFFALCAEAFHGTDWHVVIAIGDRTDSATLGPLPANVEIAPYFPQLAVLSHAHAFVSHAGMNSTMEALYYQVPLITVPQMHEQLVIANRVEDLGLGRLLDSHATTAQQLRDTVEQVAADPAIRARLIVMKQQLDSAGGAKAGADAIEYYLGLSSQ